MNNKVIIYSTPSCGYCKMAMEYLKEKGIPYIEYNVLADRQKAMEMIQKTQQMAVPVIEIDGKVMVGYNRGKINELLGL